MRFNSFQVWIAFGTWLFETGQTQQARQLLKRSFDSLPHNERE